MPSLLRQTAATLWTALRRVPKDRRARTLLLRVSLPLLCVIALTIYIFVNRAVAVFAICFDVVMFGLILWYRKRNPIERSGPVTLNLNARPDLEPTPDLHVGPELLREFQETALLQAILAHRAASEGFLKLKGVPEGKQIVTRQNHIRLLREYGMYERLGSEERDLILAPDGGWDEDVIDRVTLLLEPVRVFRWLLRLDPLLPLIGEAPLIDFPLAADLVDQPKHIFQDRGLVEMEQIRTARGGAEKIFYRCYSEGRRRGFGIDSDTEHADQAIFYAERLVGQESEDLLLGNIIVSRASDDGVRLAASLALTRIKFLRWVQERLYGTVAAEPNLRAFR